MLCERRKHYSCGKVLVLMDEFLIRVLALNGDYFPSALDDLLLQQKVTLKPESLQLIDTFAFVDVRARLSSKPQENSLTISRRHHQMEGVALRVLYRLNVNDIMTFCPLIFGHG